MYHFTRTLRHDTTGNRHAEPEGTVDRKGPQRYIANGTSKTAVAVHREQRRAVWAAYVACVAALGYAVPHFWWYLGLSWTFPGDFAEMSDQSATQVLGDWVIAILAVLFSLLPLALVKPWGHVLPRRLVLVPVWVASVGLVLWSLGYVNLRIMLATGRVVSAPAFAAEDASPAAAWGFYWYSVFLVWGISLGATAWWSRHTRC